MENKKLYRSRKNKMVCGVAGRLGEYLNVDPTIVRLITLLIVLTGGGLLVYLGAAIIIPQEPNDYE